MIELGESCNIVEARPELGLGQVLQIGICSLPWKAFHTENACDLVGKFLDCKIVNSQLGFVCFPGNHSLNKLHYLAGKTLDC